MQLDCDVAVVGAGPAGSRTARDLARAGLRVRLLEEHRAIGVPSHCSGLISLRTLREAEIGEEAVLHRLTGAFVHTQEGGEVALGGWCRAAVLETRPAPVPPQTRSRRPVQTPGCQRRGKGAPAVEVAVQLSVAGSYRPPVSK